MTNSATLVSYNFYNSYLLQKLLQQFIRAGKKETVELMLVKILMNFTRANSYTLLWVVLAVIELHRPILTFRTVKRKNKTVFKPKIQSTNKALISVGLKWIKEGVHGDLTHIKKKRLRKQLRWQARDLKKKAKTRGVFLTPTEENIIKQEANPDLYKRRQSRPLGPAFLEYVLSCFENFEDSYGAEQQELHHQRAYDGSSRYHSYKW